MSAKLVAGCLSASNLILLYTCFEACVNKRVGIAVVSEKKTQQFQSTNNDWIAPYPKKDMFLFVCFFLTEVNEASCKPRFC